MTKFISERLSLGQMKFCKCVSSYIHILFPIKLNQLLITPVFVRVKMRFSCVFQKIPLIDLVQYKEIIVFQNHFRYGKDISFCNMNFSNNAIMTSLTVVPRRQFPLYASSEFIVHSVPFKNRSFDFLS